MLRLLALLFIPLALGAQSRVQTIAPGSVTGRVTDSQTGIGIGSATLHLFSRGHSVNNEGSPPAATSLDDGTFHFDAVTPGTYILWVTQPSYVSNAGVRQSLTVQEGEALSNVSVQLQPLGAISGRVLDETGNPVARARVQLLSTFNLRGRTEPRRVRSSTTDANGKYLFEKVAPGRYYLCADPPGRAKPAARGRGDAPNPKISHPADLPPSTALTGIRTFYPRNLTFEEAGALEITPAQVVSEADIRLQSGATFHIRGRIESLGPNSLRKGATLMLGPRDAPAMGGLSRTAHAEPDGSFDIADVSNGSYTLWLFGSYASGFDEGRRGGHRRLLARQDVDVSAGDTNGVMLSLLPPINLAGQVILSNPPPNATVSQLRVTLLPAGQPGPGSYQNVAVDSNGAFSIHDLEPGEYMVRAVNAPAGTYVQSITLNRQDVMASGMDLSQGGGGELQITVRGGAAEIKGTLSAGSDGSQPATGTALLVPETIPVDGSGVLSAGIKAGGIFTLTSVPPGRYFAFAIERWSGIWQNVDFLHSMEREGTPVDVQENGHAQLQLSFVSEDQLQQAAVRLGLATQ